MTVRVFSQKKCWQGRRMTRQRRTIYERLAARKDHPDVETLYNEVRPSVPKLSLQTVYRTVGLFEELSLVRRVAVFKGHIRYDADMQPHSHFLCEVCGSVRDVESPDIPWLEIACKAGRLGAIRSYQLLLKGTCHSCLEKMAPERIRDVAETCGSVFVDAGERRRVS